MKSEATNEFRQGVGRAKALVRQGFSLWPGVPVASDSGWAWESWNSDGQYYRTTPLQASHLQQGELALNKLIHHHRAHLPKVVKDVDDWLQRTSNCLELLKEFFYKPPSEQSSWEVTIGKLALPARWKDQALHVGQAWPKLQPLLWHYLFLELSSLEPSGLSQLTWVASQAESLAGLMEFPDGKQITIRLASMGSDIHPVWLRSVLSILVDRSLRTLPEADTFIYADDLSATIRRRLEGSNYSPLQRNELTTLSATLDFSIRLLTFMKSRARRNVTELLGSMVGDGLAESLRKLNDQALREEKRLQKELDLLNRLGPHDFFATRRAKVQASSHQRQIAHALANYWYLVAKLCSDKSRAVHLAPVSEFFQRANSLPLAVRINLAVAWEQSGWPQVGRYLAGMNELIQRRGIHAGLRRHWHRRCLPRIVQQGAVGELVASGAIYNSDAGWQRTLVMLERLVYDAGEVLTEAGATAMVKLAESLPSFESALTIWPTLDKELVAEAEIAAVQHAYWVTQDVAEFRMLLAWFKQHGSVVDQLTQLRAQTESPEHAALLRRLALRRDQQSITRWCASLNLVSSFEQVFPDSVASAASQHQPTHNQAWLARYPDVFHAVLQRLDSACSSAERIAESVLGSWFPDAVQLAKEIEQLKLQLAGTSCQLEASPERFRRMQKRLENLQQRAQCPQQLSAERQSHLCDKLERRLDQAMLDDIGEQAERALAEHLNRFNVAGLRERLTEPPYDRIVPALQKLDRSQQQLAWRALSRSWDNSLRLLEEPANQKFMEQMQQRGLNLEFWTSSK